MEKAPETITVFYSAKLYKFIFFSLQSSNITQSIYESEWFQLDVKLQKMLMIVIMRSQKPSFLSIGPFNKVRIESLIAVSLFSNEPL